jgi:hypothetical protein
MHTENSITNREQSAINNCGFSTSLLGEQKLRIIPINFFEGGPPFELPIVQSEELVEAK